MKNVYIQVYFASVELFIRVLCPQCCPCLWIFTEPLVYSNVYFLYKNMCMFAWFQLSGLGRVA